MSFGGFGGLPRKPPQTGQESKLGPVESNLTPSVIPGRVGPIPNLKDLPQAPKPDPTFPPILSVPVEQNIKKLEVSWTGILHGISGYAKANREILKRLSSSVNVALAGDSLWNEKEADAFTKVLYEERISTSVSLDAPRVTFLPPRSEASTRHRVIYTMMETEKVHPEMIRMMNENYHECWTPTKWNAETFKKAGLVLPVHVIPLGIDLSIYTPTAQERIPPCTLLTTGEAGKFETPEGFLFVYIFQPSFRKGVDVLVQAFEEAFRGDPEAGLVLGITTSSIEDLGVLSKKTLKSRIWALTGRFTERQLASIYRACKVYVCTSRGEGFNLPLCLVEGTQVDTEHGPIKIEEVKSGTKVLDHNGQIATIEGVTSRNYRGSVISIRRFGDSAPIVSDPFHPHLIVRRTAPRFAQAVKDIKSGKSNPEWVQAKDVSHGDFACIPKPPTPQELTPPSIQVPDFVPDVIHEPPGFVSLPGSYENSRPVSLKTVAAHLGVGFKHISKILNHGQNNSGGRKYSEEHVNKVLSAVRECGYERPTSIRVKHTVRFTEEVGFFFGQYIADGCPMDKRRGIIITIHESKTWAENLCKRVLRDEFGIRCKSKHKDRKIILWATSTVLGRLMATLFGEGAKNKRIPPEWKNSDWIRHVVSGIFHGDGCFHRSQQRYSFSTSSQRLRQDLFEIMLKFGVFSVISKDRRDGNQTLTISEKFNQRFYEAFMPRKPYSDCIVKKSVRYDRVIETDKYFFVPIRDVKTHSFSGVLRNLHVSGGNSFTVRGMATHNCEAAACGLPVIAPRTTIHSEIVPYGHGFFFDADESRVFREAGLISKWFDGIPFADYGKTARKKLVEIMRTVKANYGEALELGKRYMTHVRSRYTWEKSVKAVVERLRLLRNT